MSLFSSEITGIDIGAGSIKAVRISGGGAQPKLISAGLVELPIESAQPPNLGVDLRYLLSGRKIGKKNVVTLISGKHLTIRLLTLPKMPRTEMNEAIRWESKRHISYPLDAAQIEYLIVGEKREGTVDKCDILLVAAERGALIEHIAPFQETGIKVSAVDANPLALRNVHRLRDIPERENTLYIDMGAGKTEINIFKGGALRFSRCLETGGQDITRAVSQETGTGLEEAEEAKKNVDILGAAEDKAAAAVKDRLDGLLLEIRRSVDYYKTTFREKSMDRTVLTGGVSLTRGIKEYFSGSIEGPVEIDDPFSVVTAKKNALEEFGPVSPRFSAAVGLALRRL